VFFPLGLVLYGVNDIVDAETDALNPRKGTFMFGARGAREQLAILKWHIAAVQLPFAALFYYFVGPRILWWYALLLLAVGLYNAPGIAWKGRPPFDVLIQASYLLVFVLSSWLSRVPQLPWQTLLFGALFAMHSHIFGEVMDIEPDRLSGRRTTATWVGRVRAKFLIAAFLCIETMLVRIFFPGLDHHNLSRLWRALVFDRRDSAVERPALSSKRNAPLPMGLERRPRPCSECSGIGPTEHDSCFSPPRDSGRETKLDKNVGNGFSGDQFGAGKPLGGSRMLPPAYAADVIQSPSRLMAALAACLESSCPGARWLPTDSTRTIY